MFTAFLLLALAADAPADLLTLSEAEAQALKHQPTVLQAQAPTEAAEGRVARRLERSGERRSALCDRPRVAPPG